MPYQKIQPATLAFNPDGTPYSASFDDIYHSASGGCAQAEHVFLKGNGLPERWQQRERFTILETGFGLGLNFLVTWAAWLADPQRSQQLHFVSLELHPFQAEDMRQLLAAYPQFASQVDELLAIWPPLTPGFHRLELSGGQVVLTLIFGDAAFWLPRIQASVDAFYLDGFAPDKNPDLWSAITLRLLVRRAAPNATLATWSVASAVRKALQEAGAVTEKRPGFGTKRDMLVGTVPWREGMKSPLRALSSREAVVIGAGVAGTSIAERLAARGWQVDVYETEDAPANGASGNISGVLRPLPSLDDNLLARLTRAGFLYTRQHLSSLERRGLPVRWQACGALHLARDSQHEQRQYKVVKELDAPADFLHYVSQEEASEIAGCTLPNGGWWFPGGGWVQPPSVCKANIESDAERIRLHAGTTVTRLEQLADGQWQLFNGRDEVIATTPCVILACGIGLRMFAQTDQLPLASARGQVTHLPADQYSAPQVVLCRQGYINPAVDGVICTGASFQVNDADPEVRVADHEENLLRLERILPTTTNHLQANQLGGRTGFRPSTPDRLPMVGAVPSGVLPPGSPSVSALPRLDGLYMLTGFGARGLVWGTLMAELLASQLHGDPLPIERELVDAVDPARFVLRPVKQFKLNDE